MEDEGLIAAMAVQFHLTRVARGICDPIVIVDIHQKV